MSTSETSTAEDFIADAIRAATIGMDRSYELALEHSSLGADQCQQLFNILQALKNLAEDLDLVKPVCPDCGATGFHDCEPLL